MPQANNLLEILAQDITEIKQALFNPDGVLNRLTKLETRLAGWSKLALIMVTVLSVVTEHMLDQAWDHKVLAKPEPVVVLRK